MQIFSHSHLNVHKKHNSNRNFSLFTIILLFRSKRGIKTIERKAQRPHPPFFNLNFFLLVKSSDRSSPPFNLLLTPLLQQRSLHNPFSIVLLWYRMKNDTGINYVGGESTGSTTGEGYNCTTDQAYNGTGITPMVINVASQLSPEWLGYCLLGCAIFILLNKVTRLLLKAK